MLLRRSGGLFGLFRPAPADLAGELRPENRRAADRVPVDRSAVLRWHEHSNECELAVQLFDRSPDGVGLVLPEQLPTGLLANVHWEGGAEIQAVVRHCRRREAQFVAGLMHLPVQRRSEDRQPLNEPARLVWDDLLHGRVNAPVQLSDLSLGGIRCHSPRKVPVPMMMCLETSVSQYYGTTRYCRESETGYTVGIQILHSTLSVEPAMLVG